VLRRSSESCAPPLAAALGGDADDRLPALRLSRAREPAHYVTELKTAKALGLTIPRCSRRRGGWDPLAAPA
jgi:hypothetical protein